MSREAVPRDATEPLLLAADVGNSKTDLVLLRRDGTVLAAVRGPSASHQAVGMGAGARQLLALAADARLAAGLPTPAVPAADRAVVCAAGADRPADVVRLRRRYLRDGLATDVLVANDTHAALRAGTDAGWGIAVVCGAGINCLGVARDGREARFPALGAISGDWGGGGELGATALWSAVRARDGRGPRTVLERLVPGRFGMDRPLDVTMAIDGGRLAQERLADLSPDVFAAAAEGDAVARALLDRLADEIVAMARSVARRLHIVRARPPVVLAGGVFRAHDAPFVDRVRDGLDRAVPGAPVPIPDAPPVVGAALWRSGRPRVRAASRGGAARCGHLSRGHGGTPVTEPRQDDAARRGNDGPRHSRGTPPAGRRRASSPSARTSCPSRVPTGRGGLGPRRSTARSPRWPPRGSTRSGSTCCGRRSSPSPAAMTRPTSAILDEVLEAARRRGLRLHPTLFIGGEVGDAYWDVPWRAGRHPHRDPEMLRLQVAHAAHLARRWRGDPALLAWDLTDEPPLWLFRDTHDAEARAWTRALAERSAKRTRTRSSRSGRRARRSAGGRSAPTSSPATSTSRLVHPYPIYAPELYPDGLLVARMTRAGAFETALAAGRGTSRSWSTSTARRPRSSRPGDRGYDRLLCWSALGRGAAGFFAWCWTDAEPAAFRRAPVRPPAARDPVRRDRVDRDAAPARSRPRGPRGDRAARGHRRVAGDGPVTTAAIPVPTSSRTRTTRRRTASRRRRPGSTSRPSSPGTRIAMRPRSWRAS